MLPPSNAAVSASGRAREKERAIKKNKINLIIHVLKYKIENE